MKNIVLFLLLLPAASGISAQQPKPNIIFILTDDMGYGDISCYNGVYNTLNIDKLATQGIRLTRYYSASPVCSPSRTGLMTGMAPAKWNMTNYLSDRKHNSNCEQADFLNPAAATIAKVFKGGGYATGHFGKWHMGGGRDVTNAPSIKDYGFDEWSSTWESPDPDPVLTAKNWIWSDQDSIKRWNRTAYFVDKTLAFLQKHSGQPCFINLWPDDVHTPWVPGGDFVKEEGDDEKNFIPVLKEYDVQIGRLMGELKRTGLDKNTIVVFTSDNGPAPNFRHDRSAGMRGAKVSLYEGGIRMPMIVSWPAQVKAGQVDSSSVVTANDMIPTLCQLAGITNTINGDGEDRSGVLLGRPSLRGKAIFWEYGRNEISFNYPKGRDRSPSLAILEGNWKLLMNKDGSRTELYNLQADKNEVSSAAEQQPGVVKALSEKLLNWWQALPKL
ncbi:sulfatase family protein [Foetidibacter luteolus]|uniref:sulfatase family protein n=1 Tax=Foetidibacter luteolus TaxID=2608880 RepID=UPI001A986672|nr:sulfatase-like hydrolase/transferase [Foetidibacter luteolus]